MNDSGGKWVEGDVESMKYGKDWYERRNEMYFLAEFWSYVKEGQMGGCKRRMPYSEMSYVYINKNLMNNRKAKFLKSHKMSIVLIEKIGSAQLESDLKAWLFKAMWYRKTSRFRSFRNTNMSRYK